jgi:myosin heavy subunit
MNKKILAAIIAVLVAVIAYLGYDLAEQKQVNKDMRELAVLEKQEMEDEYEHFAVQYGEMKTRINDDSIVAQLTREQQRTQELLEELRKTKEDDAAEITRLKKELATVREVLRSYVLQIDSLNRVNAELMDENNRVRGELAESNQQNQQLASSNMTLSEKVAIAAQLDAQDINMMPLDKKSKPIKKLKKAKRIGITFNIAKNVTAANGMRDIYVQVKQPNGEVLTSGGTFTYMERQLAYTAKRSIEYAGQKIAVDAYWEVTNALIAGTYNVTIFADGHIIGARNFTFEK